MHCAAIPHLGGLGEDGRWVDTGAEMPGFDNHVYLSETAVREACKALEYPTPGAYQAALFDAEEAELELDTARRRITYLESVIESFGLTQTYLDELAAKEKQAATKPVPKAAAK